MILPVRFRRVASGLMIERVRSTAMILLQELEKRAPYAMALCRWSARPVRRYATAPPRYKARMLAIDNIIVRIAGREILNGRHRQPARRPAHRPGRPQRRGQIDPVQGDPGPACIPTTAR